MNFSPQISISNIKPEQWPKIDNPLASYELLQLFESSGVISAESGWQPMHLCLYCNDDLHDLVAVIPSYIKSHSYGEYVFDWAWANYYHQNGKDYYPKLLTATPLTPCLAPKLLGELTLKEFQSWSYAITAWAKKHSLSSWHINFPEKSSQQNIGSLGFFKRLDIQFHWKNLEYRCFDDFLAALKPKRRKNINQERRKVKRAGWSFERKLAVEISQEEWLLFYQLYCHTFDKKAGWAQLNLKFFQGLSKALPESALVVFAYKDGNACAAALFFLSKTHLYGRYWGAFEQTDGLHFETCYYQGIEYAIEHNIQVFEPGAQGEHKLSRGFEPVLTHSYHYILDEQQRAPIQSWIQQEKHQVEQRLAYYRQHSAYR